MLSELLKSPYFWSLIFVLLGFLLGEGSRYLRYRSRLWRLKRIIKEELGSILAEIPQKKDIVQQIIAALEKQQVLPGLSVGIINMGYKQHIAELYEHFSFLERNCLHVIHEHLDINDKILSSFEHDIKSAIQEKVMASPFSFYKIHLQEILKSYNMVENLIKAYLDGKPTDVFHIKNKKKQVPPKFRITPAKD